MPLVFLYPPQKNRKPNIYSFFQGVQKETSGMIKVKILDKQLLLVDFGKY